MDYLNKEIFSKRLIDREAIQEIIKPVITLQRTRIGRYKIKLKGISVGVAYKTIAQHI